MRSALVPAMLLDSDRSAAKVAGSMENSSSIAKRTARSSRSQSSVNRSVGSPTVRMIR